MSAADSANFSHLQHPGYLTTSNPGGVVEFPRMSVASWHSGLVLRLYRWLWIGRITSARPPIPRGALVLAAHYNGAVDGFVYGSQIPAARAVVSVQWHRRWIGRLLFPGIAVQRAKDARKGGNNLQAFRRMTAALSAGERLLFFPEGTSRLGLERLPIGRGTLLLLRGVRAITPQPAVFFCAARYDTPTRWRSQVSLGWIGPVALPASSDADEAWVAEHLRAAQTAAYSQPRPPRAHWTWLGALLALPYLPLWAVTARAAQRIADDSNVISLWKFLIGVPSTLLLLGVFTALAVAFGLPAWLPLASLAGGAALWNR